VAGDRCTYLKRAIGVAIARALVIRVLSSARSRRSHPNGFKGVLTGTRVFSDEHGNSGDESPGSRIPTSRARTANPEPESVRRKHLSPSDAPCYGCAVYILEYTEVAIHDG